MMHPQPTANRATGRIYLNGRFVTADEATIPVTNQAFNYGTGIFEGIRAYTDRFGNAMNVFRLADHIERLQRSATLMRLDIDRSTAELMTLISSVLEENGCVQDTYVRPIVYKAALLPGAGFGVRLSGVSTEFAITTVLMGQYTRDVGLRCAVSPWRRVPDCALPAGAKITGSYANNALAMEHAQSAGLDDGLLLDIRGNLAEATTSNVFLVSGGRLLTPPRSADILPGITRSTVIELAANELGLSTEENELSLADLYGADECFLTGTGVEVAPVVEVDHRPIGTGSVGATTLAIRRLYHDVVRGTSPRYQHWLTPVEIPDQRDGGQS